MENSKFWLISMHKNHAKSISVLNNPYDFLHNLHLMNYSNLLNKLLPVIYKWTIEKEKAFENLHRQDSWGSFGNKEDA
uniref:Uncharacterized protein n=1 Tax=Onchocerca volvulus TaxID=6282 RepID=A0A8R1TMI9_ONCVO